MKKDWSPKTLLETSGSYWETCTLHAGVKLAVFSVIGQEALTSKEIATKINADERGITRLLDALSAMNLLNKIKNKYSNTSISKNFLSQESDQYMGFMIMHHHYLMESWVNMDQAIIDGTKSRDRSSSFDEKKLECFLMGMFNMAMSIAPNLAPIINLKDCTHLLDMGGGPGTYAIHFCLNNPDLKAKVYDRSTTRPFAEKTIKKFKVSDRIKFIDGDFIQDDFIYKSEFDVAWLSHILHGEGPEGAEMIIKKAVSGLKSNGKIFIHEFIMKDEMDGPLFPALFSINMFLGTNNGQSYSEKQLFCMLDKFGIKDIKRLNFVGPTESGIITGIKN